MIFLCEKHNIEHDVLSWNILINDAALSEECCVGSLMWADNNPEWNFSVGTAGAAAPVFTGNITAQSHCHTVTLAHR